MILHFLLVFALLEFNCLVKDYYFSYLTQVVITVMIAFIINVFFIFGGLI